MLPSQKERENLALCEALVEGGAVTPQEAARLLPGREQFVRLWQSLLQMSDNGQIAELRLPALRRLAAGLGGAEPFLRTELGLEIFAERNLICLHQEKERLEITIHRGEKVVLEESRYMRRLLDILGIERKEGQHSGYH